MDFLPGSFEHYWQLLSYTKSKLWMTKFSVAFPSSVETILKALMNFWCCQWKQQTCSLKRKTWIIKQELLLMTIETMEVIDGYNPASKAEVDFPWLWQVSSKPFFHDDGKTAMTRHSRARLALSWQRWFGLWKPASEIHHLGEDSMVTLVLWFEFVCFSCDVNSHLVHLTRSSKTWKHGDNE